MCSGKHLSPGGLRSDRSLRAMNDSRRRTVAAAGLALALSVLVGCSARSGHGPRTNLGAATDLPSTVPAPNDRLNGSAPASGGATAGGSTSGAPTAGAPKPNPNPPPHPVGSTKPGGAGTHTSAPATQTVSTVPSPSPHVGYAVTATGVCYWRVYNDAGNHLLQIGAEFQIRYTGGAAPTTVPFLLTWSPNIDNTSGNATIGTPFTWYDGLELVSGNGLYNKTVTLTGTINDTTGDDFAGDNTAAARVSVPDSGSLPSDFNPHAVPCSAA